MLRHLLLGLSLVVIAAAVASAEDTAAYNKLRAAPQFAAGPVGLAGVTSDEEAALHDLLSRPGASVELRRLLSEATLAGQLYALWGLAVAGDADFPQLSEKYAAVDTEVETMNGCVVEREGVSAIVRRIRDGKYGKPRN
jgi:hypothetical protein